MKSLANKAIFIATGLLALPASAAITVNDSNTSSFNIGGQILPECKVANFSPEQATALDLTSSTAQPSATVSVWCNTGQNSANTTYTSTNAGYLVDGTGNRIAYNLGIPGSASDLNLATPQTVSQSAGLGTAGESQDTTVSIIPQVNGFETAGAYSDTIAVTVSFN